MLMLINLVKDLLVKFDLIVVVLQVHMIDVNAKDLVMLLLHLHHHYDHLYLFAEQEWLYERYSFDDLPKINKDTFFFQ
jgi:hypothetical protein